MKESMHVFSSPPSTGRKADGRRQGRMGRACLFWHEHSITPAYSAFYSSLGKGSSLQSDGSSQAER